MHASCVQGVTWTYESLAKDMLDLHDPAALTAVHAYLVQKDEKLKSPQHPSLEDTNADCIACYTAWFKDLHSKFSDQDLVLTAARTEAATRAATWQLIDMPDTQTPHAVIDTILLASSLQLTGDTSVPWLSVIACSVALSVPDLVQKLQDAHSNSLYVQSMLPSADASCNMHTLLEQHSQVSAVQPHWWRLSAIALQRTIYVLDIPHSRICCYPSHDGPVSVRGAADCCNHPNNWAMSSWGHPGFFFVLGRLPLPTSLSQSDSSVFVLPDAVSVQATAKLTVEDADAQAAESSLATMGVEFADLQFDAVGKILHIDAGIARSLVLVGHYWQLWLSVWQGLP